MSERRVIGFFTDEEGVVHPITASHAKAIRRDHAKAPGHERAAGPLSELEWERIHAEAIAEEEAQELEQLAQELEQRARYQEFDVAEQRRHITEASAVRKVGGHRAAGSVRWQGWTAMRSEIKRRGGLASGRDYDPADIPRGVYRLRGEAPDKLAQELGWDNGDDMIRDLNREFAMYKSARRAPGAGGVGRRRSKLWACTDSPRCSSH